MLALDIRRNRAARSIGAGTEHKALLDQTAGQFVEVANPARLGDHAARNAPIRGNRKPHLDETTDPAIAELAGIVGRPDASGNLLELGAPVALAAALSIATTVAIAARAATGASTYCRPAASLGSAGGDDGREGQHDDGRRLDGGELLDGGRRLDTASEGWARLGGGRS